MATILPGSPPSYDKANVQATAKALCGWGRTLQENLDFQLTQARRDAEGARKEIETLKAAVAALQNGLDAAQRNIETAEKNYSKLEQRVAELERKAAN